MRTVEIRGACDVFVERYATRCPNCRRRLRAGESHRCKVTIQKRRQKHEAAK